MVATPTAPPSAASRPAVSDRHRLQAAQLDVPTRLLLGPGPSNAHPRVLQALGMRQVGHLDPAFIELMNETQELLRYVWQTDNEVTIPVSGTGSASCFSPTNTSTRALMIGRRSMLSPSISTQIL